MACANRSSLLLAAVPLFLNLGQSIEAGTLRPLSFGRSANETTCQVSARSERFTSSDSEIFLAFPAERVAAGETLRIDWVSPAGEVESSVPYEGLPSAPSLCFVSHLPVAGFAPAGQPGTWQVRIYWNGALSTSKAFQIVGEPNTGLTRIDNVSRSSSGAGDAELTLDGRAFTPGSVVHIAQLSGRVWRYIHAAIPVEVEATRLRVRTPALAVGEYLAVIRDETDRVSNSARFVIATRESYKLPLPAGEPWMLTQGPYGGFSHYGQALHAYDIAPVQGRCLVAMRGGIVHAFDRGMTQSHASRTFGNYITIDHGDGEYSHYAHLASRSFVVRTGQRVEQGQALATVGNSGYTFPLGGGHHVHVHVTRSFAVSAQSIPFEFEDLRAKPRTRGVIVSTNRSPHCDCSRPMPASPTTEVSILRTTESTSASTARPGARVETGNVPVADWWNSFLTVRPGSRSLEVTAHPENPGEDIDLHLVSPSGIHYGWYGNITGYSGQDGALERFQLANPEPGKWRVSVQGMRGTSGQIPFRIETYAGSAAFASNRGR